MRLSAISIYLIIMLCFYLEGFKPAFYTMLVLGAFFVAFAFFFKNLTIRVAKMKIYETLKLCKAGQEISPFIDINSSPWYILAELPGMTIEAAKRAEKLRLEKGLYPSIESFIKVAEIKPRFISSLVKVAYVNKKIK